MNIDIRLCNVRCWMFFLDPVPANELNKVEKCGMGARSQCRTIIGLWGVGFPGYCINGPMGFRFGGTKGYKQAALEVFNYIL